MLIDSHCHLDFSSFDHDRAQVLAKCAELSIDTLIVPGTRANRWQELLQLCQQYDMLKPALGLHPYFLAEFQQDDFELLTRLLEQTTDKVVALGEIGLDFAIDVDSQLQMTVLNRQLQIANDFQLPVILHHRRSHNALIRALKTQHFKLGGIVHAFSGSLQEASTYIELGFKLGVGGTITYPRAQKTRETIRQLPLHSLVLETDAPDMPPFGKQGMRNIPQNLLQILDALSELRQQSPEEIAVQCRKNVLESLKNIQS